MTTFVIRSTIDRRPKPQPGFLGRVMEMLTLWHDRSVQRRALAGLSEHQLHDIGLSRSQISHEIDKPFWRV